LQIAVAIRAELQDLEDKGHPHTAIVAMLKNGPTPWRQRCLPAPGGCARPCRQFARRHILAWAIALYGGDKVPSADIATPQRCCELGRVRSPCARKRARLYRENPSPQTVVQAFDGKPPADSSRAW